MSGADDQAVLEWAAQEERVLLTHDVRTITQYAYERVDADQLMPGVFEVSPDISIGRAIEDILLLAESSLDGEWESTDTLLAFVDMLSLVAGRSQLSCLKPWKARLKSK